MSFIEFLKQNKRVNESTGEAGKTADNVDADKIFMRNIAISFFAIIVCIVMLTASTFAWYTTTIESKNTIGSSIYKLDVDVIDGTEITATQNADGNSVYNLSAGTTYTVTVTAVTENTNGNTGYIKLIYGSDTYYSEQVDRGESISFTLKFTNDAQITIIERWGISIVDENDRDLHNGDAITDLAPKVNN